MCVSPMFPSRRSRESWEVVFGSVGAFERGRGEENYFFIVRFAKWSLRSCDIIQTLCQAGWNGSSWQTSRVNV